MRIERHVHLALHPLRLLGRRGDDDHEMRAHRVKGEGDRRRKPGAAFDAILIVEAVDAGSSQRLSQPLRKPAVVRMSGGVGDEYLHPERAWRGIDGCWHYGRKTRCEHLFPCRASAVSSSSSSPPPPSRRRINSRTRPARICSSTRQRGRLASVERRPLLSDGVKEWWSRTGSNR